jgi:hypothetical protein
MKSMLKSLIVATLAFGFTAGSLAAKEITVTGEGKCAKCSLKKSDTCQNVVEVKDGDKTTTYYLTGDVSKGFHKNLCTTTAKVKVTGNASEKDGKQMIEVTAIKKVE